MISQEDIEKFLQGNDDEKYIVSVEYDYTTDAIYKVIEDPIKGKMIKKDTFTPFCWVGDLRGVNFYQGSKDLQKAAMTKYGIMIIKLETSGNERLENGLKFMVKAMKGYRALVQFFRTDIQGFLPKMMEEMYEDRKKFKKMMIQAKKDYEVEKDDTKKYDIEKRIARYNNLQLAKKVSLNSAYGALGSQYFRFYDLRMALGVTTAGQFSIRWIESKINGYMNSLLKTNRDYVIASDTDSIYLRMSELVDKFIKDTSDKNKVISVMDKICEEKIQQKRLPKEL